jgi:HTH-like domain
MTKFDVSERLACRVLGQHRSTQRKASKGRADDAALTADVVALATQYGRYGYRRIAALLRAAGWAVNVKRVERIWRQEGLKVPGRQPKEGTLVADRRLMRRAPAGTAKPRLVLRFRRGPHSQRQEAPHAERHR